jgi:hypothetical protein
MRYRCRNRNSALADVHEGEELILEMKKAGVKSYIEVTRLSTGEKETVEDDSEDKEEGDTSLMPDCVFALPVRFVQAADVVATQLLKRNLHCTNLLILLVEPARIELATS